LEQQFDLKPYQQRLARLLASSGALFFAPDLRLKDGRPTPYFVNLGKLNTGRMILELGRCLAGWIADHGLAGEVQVLLGPSYKGSALAQAAAVALWQDEGMDLAFDYDRKEAKTHGEASGQKAMFVTGALTPGAKVLIIDDVGTSMATKKELLDKLAAEGQRLGRPFDVRGVLLAVDRQQTQAVYDGQGQLVEGVRGPDALASFVQETGVMVWALLGIREMVAFLAQAGEPVNQGGVMRPLEPADVAQVEEYLAVYGREH
jgi:orotate phosphoribosyltransferase